MRSLFILLLLSACYFSASSATWIPTKYNLKDFCGKRIFVDKDVLIYLTKNAFFDSNTVCRVTLFPRNQGQLAATLVSYQINDAFVDKNHCIYMSVQLGSSNDSTLLGPYGYCQYDCPQSQYDLMYTGTFSYRTGPYILSSALDVTLLVSEVFISQTTGSCQNELFDCQSHHQCIDRNLTCNGYKDCANGEDEAGCTDPSHEYTGLSLSLTGEIVGGVFGIIIFVMILAVVCSKSSSHHRDYVQY